MLFDDEARSKFCYCGENNRYSRSIDINKPERIWLGSNCYFGNNVSLGINPLGCSNDVQWNIKINDNIYMNNNCYLEALNQIEIGKFVMFGPDVFISDNNHKYDFWKMPIMMQGFENKKKKVFIRDGAWVGAGAKIIGNVTIGYGAVVAANAVVLDDVPDHCMVAGIPAEVIKICNYADNAWVKVKSNRKLFNEILSSRCKFDGYDYNWIAQHIGRNPDKEDSDKKVIKDLMDNICELFDEISIYLQKNEFSTAVNLFKEAIEKIIKVEEIMKNDKSNCYVLNSMAILNTDLSELAFSFEKNNIDLIKHVLRNKVIPDIQVWKSKIYRIQ